MSAPQHDEQLKKLLQESGIDMPAPDFTDRVMDRIAALPASKPVEYKPLIGKLGWLAIGLGAVAVIVAVLSSTGFSSSNVDLLPDLKQYLPSPPEVNIPNVSPVLLFSILAIWLIVVAERIVDRVRS